MSGLKRRVNDGPLEYLEKYFPNGKVKGDEFELGDVRGSPGKSLKFNFKKNTWKDFADPADLAGRGFITLYAAFLGVEVPQAWYELTRLEEAGVISKKSEKLLAEARTGQHWEYQDASGKTVMVVRRVDRAAGKKDFYPCSFIEGAWRKKRFPPPVPLYNLDQVMRMKRVIVVEGEKAADALKVVVGEAYAVTTWAGGTNSLTKTDWSPLHGKKVLLWPDNDSPGRACMDKLWTLIEGNVETMAFLRVDDLPSKADAADVPLKDLNAFREWTKGRVGEKGVKKKKERPSVPAIFDALESTGTSMEEVHDSLYPPSTVAAQKGLTRGASGTLHPSYNNVYRLIEKDYKDNFWWDEFEQMPMTDFREAGPMPLTSNKVSHLLGVLQGKGMPRLGRAVVDEAIKAYVVATHTPKRNKQRDWLDSLDWDKEERLARFLHTYMGAADNQYTSAVSRNLIMSMVARMDRPGTKVDTMVVLEGAQGIGKGRALSALAGGPKLYAEESGRFDNDMVIRLIGKSIIEFSEMVKVTSRDYEAFKSYSTRTHDRICRKWCKDAEDIPRTAVWVGSTNRKAYIYDETGGRRFLPVSVSNIYVDRIEKDRDQLIAEAYTRYKNGEVWWTVPAGLAKMEQLKRRVIDPWEPVLKKKLQYERATGSTETTIEDVLKGYLHLEVRELTERNSARAEKILTSIGYEKRIDGLGYPSFVYVDTY